MLTPYNEGFRGSSYREAGEILVSGMPDGFGCSGEPVQALGCAA